MIDVSEWGEFRVGTLLNMEKQIELSPIEAFNKNAPNDIKYPFYGQSSENNGIIDYYYLGEELLNNRDSAHCIMIHSNTHLAYYVNTPFYLKDGHGATTIFTNEHFTELSTYFVISVLNKTMFDKFDYDMKATKEKLNDLIIKLPVTPEGQPNWNYMESYMKHIWEESEKSLSNLKKVDTTKHMINVSNWKKFKVRDLFDIHPTSAYKMTNKELMNDDGINPVIVNSGFNNGVGGYTNQKCTENAGVITFTDTAAKSSESFFFQDVDFVGYPHVQGMYCKNHALNEYEGKFIATILRSAAGKFDFIRDVFKLAERGNIKKLVVFQQEKTGIRKFARKGKVIYNNK